MLELAHNYKEELSSEEFLMLQFSIIMHDYFHGYGIHGEDESESALKAIEILKYSIFSHNCEWVFNTIKNTGKYSDDLSSIELDKLTQVLLDLDLSSFALKLTNNGVELHNLTTFISQQSLVAAELKGSLKNSAIFLKNTFLVKQRIYYSEFMHNNYEQIARSIISDFVKKYNY
jgi:predicted metal-dependent HD superfamily phosphohydrolase